jgi:hypothetical protein
MRIALYCRSGHLDSRLQGRAIIPARPTHATFGFDPTADQKPRLSDQRGRMPAVRAYTLGLPPPDRTRMVRIRRVTSHREIGSER